MGRITEMQVAVAIVTMP